MSQKNDICKRQRIEHSLLNNSILACFMHRKLPIKYYRQTTTPARDRENNSLALWSHNIPASDFSLSNYLREMRESERKEVLA